MGDYFALLAARLAGATEAVRPVVPSRFEAQAGTDSRLAPPSEATSHLPAADDIGIIERHEEIPAAALPAEKPSHRRGRPWRVSRASEPAPDPLTSTGSIPVEPV